MSAQPVMLSKDTIERAEETVALLGECFRNVDRLYHIAGEHEDVRRLERLGDDRAALAKVLGDIVELYS